MATPGLVSPNSFPIRDPKDRSLTSGRIVNSPRYAEMGGIDGPGVWDKESSPSGFAQASQENTFRVERPTSIKSAHTSERGDD